MVNFQKLLDAHGGEGAEFRYSREVVRRIERWLGRQPDLSQSIALMHILTLYSFEYDDGFVINDERGIIELIGLAEAASIVATFWDDPKQDWEWFRMAYWDVDKSKPEYQDVFNSTLGQILQDPTVRIREIGEP